MKNNAILLISCLDRKGIVASVSQFLYHHGANIIHADQHLDQELNLFFMRIEWSLEDFDLTIKEFEQDFREISLRFKMNWRVARSNDYFKLAVFVSKQDHCLADLLYRYDQNELNCEIKLIISNHSDAKKLADFYNIPFYEISVNKSDRKTSDIKTLSLLIKYNIDLIVLARYMQIISPKVIKKFPNKIINIHHSFLPSFIGSNPYKQAYNRGVKIIGSTSHYITEGLDDGPIIEQDVIRISHRDDVNDLIKKGRDLEKIVFFRAIKWHTENRILIYSNKTVVFN